MTNIDRSADAIAKVLDGVTDGPWFANDLSCTVTDKEVWFDGSNARHGETPNIVMQADCAANARFIAAARDLVPALSAERDALKNTHWQVEAMQQDALLHDALTRAEIAEAKLARAVEALRPFAKAAETWEPDDGDSNLGARIEHPHYGLERHAEFTFGDLRHARATLAELEKTE